MSSLVAVKASDRCFMLSPCLLVLVDYLWMTFDTITVLQLGLRIIIST